MDILKNYWENLNCTKIGKRIGTGLIDLSLRSVRFKGNKNGLLIFSDGSQYEAASYNCGLKAGDLLRRINDRSIKDSAGEAQTLKVQKNHVDHSIIAIIKLRKRSNTLYLPEKKQNGTI